LVDAIQSTIQSFDIIVYTALPQTLGEHCITTPHTQDRDEYAMTEHEQLSPLFTHQQPVPTRACS
jgi:hypothetical protein